MNKVAFFTGGEGFIGSYLVALLQWKGCNVTGGYRLNGSNSFPKLPNLEFGDMPAGISTSENSLNVLRRLATFKKPGLHTLGLAGCTGRQI
jgi:nucleoside-diphosphate-sugar epimerase